MADDRATPNRLGLIAIMLAWLCWGMINASRLHLDIGLPWPRALWFGLPDAVIWAALMPLVAWICARLPIGRDNLARRLPVHALIALVLAVGHNALDASMHAARRMLTGYSAGFLDTFTSVLGHTLHLNLVIYFLVVGFVHLLRYHKRLGERERQAAELRAQLSEARLKALRMQLQPHFLFNALNTVSGLMRSDVEGARTMLRQLGDLLRLSLDGGDRSTIPLEQELAFVTAYLEIERTRFADRMAWRVDADPELLATPVPPFVLQPLVENAVRHGLSLNPDGGTIEIAARRRNGAIDLSVLDEGAGVAGGGGYGQRRRPFQHAQAPGGALRRSRRADAPHQRARWPHGDDLAPAGAAMSVLRVLIVDDEPVARSYLRELLEGEAVEVAGECRNGDEAARWLDQHPVDLLFLDVRMPQVDGFALLRDLAPERRPPVIFVTAHRSHAADAFDVAAVDYLLKPFDRERLRQALERARRQRSSSGGRIALRDGSRTVLLAPGEIVWVESESNYVRVHLDSGSRLVRMTLSELERRLAPHRFARIHRGTLVNLDRIVRVQPTGRGDATVVLACGGELALSRRYRERLHHALGS